MKRWINLEHVEVLLSEFDLWDYIVKELGADGYL